MARDSTIVVFSEGMEDLLHDPVEAKKALETIDIRATNRPISLLQHKLYNVWIAFAQSTPQAAETRIFEFPLNEVMELCGFDSHNTGYFIESAKEIFDLRVEYNSLGRQIAIGEKNTKGQGRQKAIRPTKWAAAQLISFIEIDTSVNRMRVEFPEVIRQEILRPDQYRAIDLHLQTQFSSRAGLALYEYVLRYAADGYTPWLPWETYSISLSGAAQAHKTMREFSKMLKRAIDQVNSHHHSHLVHAEFTKRGRAFHRMRIGIVLRHQTVLPFNAGEPIPAEINEALRRVGLNDREIESIVRAHPLEYLRAHIAYIQKRLNDRSREAIKVPAAFLRSALAGNYAGHRSDAARVTNEAPPSMRIATPTTAVERDMRTGAAAPPSNEAVRLWFSGLPETERSMLASAFYEAVPVAIRKVIERSGLESKVASAAFFGWLREEGQYPVGQQTDI